MELSEVFKTLGDENRLRILGILFKQDLCVCEVEMILNMTQSNVSRHLAKLKNAGIISYDKQAQWVYYEISKKFIERYPKLYELLVEESKISRTYEKDMALLEQYKDSNCSFVEFKETIL
ncbi:MAG: transcriptional regulator [Firmicutes bacterium HGW-Firmicutes-2]|jgi:ArsR family transcriptional regulator|nr:MAG: transcriptional regulator [Firmicutes bacterium HGW-Firmicutes-2]